MFDPPSNTDLNVANAEVQAWLALLTAEPDLAVDRLLQGAVWLGSYASLDAPQALPQFMPEALLDSLDHALLRWLAKRQQRSSLPEGFTAKRFAQALADAFGLLQTLDLPMCQSWTRQLVLSLWNWLGTQPNFPSREPRAQFLRALALLQPNRDLLGFWFTLCRQADPRWAQLALFGLRRIPIDDDGTPSPGLSLVLVNGLIDYGLALVQREHEAMPLKKKWLAELDFLSAVYPMSQQRWKERFREALAPRKGAAVTSLRHWLDERYPAIDQAVSTRPRQKHMPLNPPHWDDDIQPLLRRFDGMKNAVRPALQAQVDRHIFYARASGDGSFLVVSLCRLATFLTENAADADQLPRDPSWAIDLAQEATRWAPGNPRCWSALAMALDAYGDWPRALAVFWYARRRFPYNELAHSQLGYALMRREMFAESEAINRAAILRFPDSAVCWGELGHTLHMSGQLDESAKTYLEARQRFSQNPSICNSLVNVFLSIGDVEKTRDALAWTEQIAPNDTRNDQILRGLQKRFRELANGQTPQKRSLTPRPLQEKTGDWSVLERCAGIDLCGIDALGFSSLWRQRGAEGDSQRARSALDDAASRLVQGQGDARWLAEEGLWLTANKGFTAGRDFFDEVTASRPGDGVLSMLAQHAHVLAGDPVDWQILWKRHPEMTPLLRLVNNPNALLPKELQAALTNVTRRDGHVDLDELDEGLRQEKWLYDNVASLNLAEIGRQDFLAARQLI